MKKSDIVQHILADRSGQPLNVQHPVFAPSNIALCKYWGKRDSNLNLPMTSSLSVSLGDKGAHTLIREIDHQQDQIILNHQTLPLNSSFGQRLVSFLDLFRPAPNIHYEVITEMNIPVAAGLASSACGAAAVVLALDQLYGWQLDKKSLSILARLGSGSASRSLWHGFVEWHAGDDQNGWDSHGELLPFQWQELRIGLHLLNTQQKPLSSRAAMQRTVETSQLYAAWPTQVKNDLSSLKQALIDQDFLKLGQVAESNALAMHATMLSAWPPIMYSQTETLSAMQKIWQLRAERIPIFFTQDAGPNLKLLFLKSNQSEITAVFPNLEICIPFK